LIEANAHLRALETHGKDPSIDALELMSDIKFEQALETEALSYLQQAIEVAVEKGEGLSIARLKSRLGLLSLQRGETQLAQELFLEAQPHDPDMASVLKLEAELLYASNETKTAFERMELAKAKSGDHWSESDELRLIAMQ
ncbi:MAG: hypothetical protein AAF296_09355, partial [Pseudomonadota bacterium]